MQLSDLPDECLVRVIRQLPPDERLSVSVLSRRFNWLSWHPSLWTRARLAITSQDCSADQLSALSAIISRIGPQVTDLTFDLASCVDINQYVDQLPNVDILTLLGFMRWQSDQGDSNIVQFLLQLPNLNHLVIERFVTNEMLTRIFSRCNPLSSVVMLDLEMRDDVVRTIMSCHSSTVTSIAFNAYNLTDYAFEELPSCSKLTKLRLKKSRYLKEVFLRNACQLNNLQLLELSFIRCPFDAPVLEQFFSSLPAKSLKALSIMCSDIMNSVCLENLAYIEPPLRSLTLSACTAINDESCAAIAKFSELRVLDLRLCPHVTAAGLAKVTSLPCLLLIDIRGCVLIGDCRLASDQRRIEVLRVRGEEDILAVISVKMRHSGRYLPWDSDDCSYLTQDILTTKSAKTKTSGSYLPRDCGDTSSNRKLLVVVNQVNHGVESHFTHSSSIVASAAAAAVVTMVAVSSAGFPADES